MLENGEFTGWKGEGGGNPSFIVCAVSIIVFFVSGNVLGQAREGRDEFETPLSPFAVPPAVE